MTARGGRFALALLLAVTGALMTGHAQQRPAIDLVTLASPESPLVSIRLMFRAGSIHDPKGKEGLSALTALMIGRAGTARRSYSELLDALYPMAASIDVITDREVTVIASQVHEDTLTPFMALLEEALLLPGLREDDFVRNRDQLRAFLTTTLRSANDELLGLELIQQHIYRDHPYGHAPAGTVDGLASITLADVKQFYNEHYTRANLIVGVGGGYPAGFPAALVERLHRLPAGSAGGVDLPQPATVKGRHFTLIDKAADSTGLHFGYPLPITRKDAAFYALMVANSYFGEHRTFHGRLMQELRGKRGLNYGDYSYIEYWDNAPGTSNPPPNHPRREQYFSVWVRPVAPAHSIFALRAAIHELERLVANGLTAEQFALTRDYLVNYSKLWAMTLSDRLGFLMDSRFYGMPYFIEEIERQLTSLEPGDVNRAIRKYLQSENFVAVMITGEAAALRDRLAGGTPTVIEYPNPVGDDVVSADRVIATLPLEPASIRIQPIGQTFTTSGRTSRDGVADAATTGLAHQSVRKGAPHGAHCR